MYDIDAQANHEGLRFCPRCGGALANQEVRGHPRLTCSECSYIFYLSPATVSCVLIERDGAVLFVLRKYPPGKGEWCLPAGFIEPGEQPDESAAREVKEETGLDVRIVGLLDCWATDEDPRTPVVSLAFEGVITGGEIEPGDDAEDARFFAFDALPERIAFAEHRKVVKDYASGREITDR